MSTEEKFSQSSSSSADEEQFVHVQKPKEQQVDLEQHNIVDSTTTLTTAAETTEPLINIDQDDANSLLSGISQRTPESVVATNDDLVSQLVADISKTVNQAKSFISEANSTTNDEPVVIKKQPAVVTVEEPKPKPSEPVKQPEPQKPEPKKPETTETKKCSTCPVGNYLNHLVLKLDAYPKVKDVLLWKDPKISGSIFVFSLVLLYSLATYSLLSIIGFNLLLTMIIIGSYRLYLAILFRVKGTQDDTFNKLSSANITLPKDKLDNIVSLVHSNGNKLVNQLKLLLLWDNVYASLAALVGAYVIYSIGCTFNTLTLITIGLVDAFTLPKVYVMYKAPIDNVLNKIHEKTFEIIVQLKQKFPKLFPKKKTQ